MKYYETILAFISGHKYIYIEKYPWILIYNGVSLPQRAHGTFLF